MALFDDCDDFVKNNRDKDNRIHFITANPHLFTFDGSYQMPILYYWLEVMAKLIKLPFKWLKNPIKLK